MIRIGVTNKKALQAHDIGRVLRPDQDRADGARFDQGDTAQHQRAHDTVAEFGSAIITVRRFSGGIKSASTSSTA